MPANAQVNADSLYEKKESFYHRNFFSLMLEAFFFSFAVTMFSQESVLPVYVNSLSERPFFLALMSAIYYSLTYGATIISCAIGVNAKSPKWISVNICLLQRLGFLLIFLSSFMAGGNTGIALLTFFFSLFIMSASMGMSNPLFAQMISTSIHRNVGSFYGAYSMAGAGSGVLASLVLTKCMSVYGFPLNFRIAFLLGLVSSLIATMIVIFGVKEVTDDRVVEKIRLRELPSISAKILKENREFRAFTLVKMLLGAAEFAIPYYIVTASRLEGVPAGFVGMMATVFLGSKMIGSIVLGKIGDRFGALAILSVSCFCGVIASFLAVSLHSYQVAFLMYALLSFATVGILLSNNIACITYSKRVRTPIYSATVGILCAPLYIITSLGGAAIASLFSVRVIFIIALVVYGAGAAHTFILLRRNR